MRIAITGSTGLVGTAVTHALCAAGHQVVRFVRGRSSDARTRTEDTVLSDTVLWDPATGAIESAAADALDAVVHLAGENVAAGHWSAARRRAIADSRGPATEKLCRSLAALPTPPRILIGASATGIYGDRGDELLHEASATGSGFLAEVATAWEGGTAPLAHVGARVVNLRIGVVLDRSGGALAKMLLPFRLGIGGRLGSGRQWMSWISLHDLVRAVTYALEHDALRGPVLAVAPEPVTNAEFTRTLGKVLRRPTILPVPAFALRLLFGEMADAMLLAGQRARPQRLLDAGFAFDHASLEVALRATLARPDPSDA